MISTHKKSMEEVWKDITFSTLHSTTTSTAARLAAQPSPGPETTAQRVNSGKEEQDGIFGGTQWGNELCFMATLNSEVEAIASSESVWSRLCSKKRLPEKESSGDRRYKRMMKNRESAARSRARRQAYTTELEREVSHLLEENAKLRKQEEKLILAARVEVPKKRNLSRTLTAPF